METEAFLIRWSFFLDYTTQRPSRAFFILTALCLYAFLFIHPFILRRARCRKVCCKRLNIFVHPVGTGFTFSGCEAAGTWGWSLTYISTEVKNVWSYTSTSTYICMTWCLTKHGKLPHPLHTLRFQNRMAKIEALRFVYLSNVIMITLPVYDFVIT
jgi:hypothetical protein